MKWRAIALSLLMVTSVFAGVAAAAPGDGQPGQDTTESDGSGSSGMAPAPPGFVGIPSENIYSDLPEQTPMGQQAQEIASAGVLASENQSTLEVVVTSPGRAKNKIDGGQMQGSGPIAIVLTDDVNSDGRKVGLPKEELADALGRVPQLAFGTHEDGTPWTRVTTITENWVVVEIPHFSTNTITWSGQLTIEGEPAADGASWRYTQNDSVDNYLINVTGAETTENDTISMDNLQNGESISADIGGNLNPPSTTLTFEGNQYTGSTYTPTATGDDTITIEGDAEPTGPNGGEPEITFTGRETTTDRTILVTDDSGGTKSYSVNGNLPTSSASVEFVGNENTGSLTTDSGGDSGTIDPPGNLDPKGPSGSNEPEITFSGRESTVWNNASETSISDGSLSLNVGGNLAPAGPSTNSEPTVTFTGNTNTQNQQYSNTSSTAFSDSISVGGNQQPTNEELTVNLQKQEWYDETNYYTEYSPSYTSPYGTYTTVKVKLYATYDYTGDQVSVSTSLDGTSSKSESTEPGTTHWFTFTGSWTANSFEVFEGEYDSEIYISRVSIYSQLPGDVDVTTDGTTHSFSGSGEKTKSIDLSTGSNSIDYTQTNSTGKTSITVDYTEKTATEDPGLDYDNDGTDEASHTGILTSGETVTKEIPGLSPGDDTAPVSVTAGTVDADVSFKERTGTEDPRVDIDDDGTADASASGILASGETTMVELAKLDETSQTVDTWTATTGPAPDWQIDYNPYYATEDPSLDVDNDGTPEVSYTGILTSGETHSESITNFDPGDYTADFSIAGHTADWTLWYTEHTGTEDPSADVTGDGSADATHSGVLAGGETATYQIANLTTGSTTIDTEVVAGNLPEWTITYDEELFSDSPSIDIDGDGTDEASHSGKLSGGETAEYTIDPALEDDSWNVSTVAGPIDVETTIQERTISENVTIYVNGNEATHAGVLEDGNTTSLTADPAWIKTSGENNVTVEVAPSLSADAPKPSVGLYYTHNGVDNDLVALESEKWSERYNVSKTFAEDQAEANLTIPFNGAVTSIRTLEYSMNGGDWQSVQDSNFQFEGTTLSVQLGAVSAGDEVAVRTVGSKVNVYNGKIQVQEPTLSGEILDTKFEVLEKGSDFAIEVTNALEDERVWYTEDESWQEADPYALVEANGKQTLKMPNANNGSTARVHNLPLWVEPGTDVEVLVKDPDVPRFALRPGPNDGELVDVVWSDTVSGQAYELRDITNDRQVDIDVAESPINFTTSDGALTYEILETTLSSADGTGGGALPDQSSSAFPVVLIGAIVLGLGGLVLVVRWIGGFGGDDRTGQTSSRSDGISIGGYEIPVPSLPVPSMPDAKDRTQQVVLYGGLGIIAIVALELSTPDSLYQTLLVASAMGSKRIGELVTVGTGIAALLGLWLLDQRTTESIPRWLMAVAAVVIVVYVLETIQPGVLLGPASDGFGTIAPLFWLVLIVGGAYVAYGWIQSRRSPDTRVTLQLRGNNK